MVSQYPHTIYFGSNADSTQDADGNWVPGVAGSDKVLKCRVEAQSLQGQIVSADGSRSDFSWIVYLPLPVDEVPEGMAVTVKDGLITILTDNVKKFHKGQLNARIWL